MPWSALQSQTTWHVQHEMHCKAQIAWNALQSPDCQSCCNECQSCCKAQIASHDTAMKCAAKPRLPGMRRKVQIASHAAKAVCQSRYCHGMHYKAQSARNTLQSSDPPVMLQARTASHVAAQRHEDCMLRLCQLSNSTVSACASSVTAQSSAEFFPCYCTVARRCMPKLCRFSNSTLQ